MNKVGLMGMAGLIAVASVVVGPAEAFVRQSWDPAMVAYGYTYYADAAKTEQLGYVEDWCRVSISGQPSVMHPNIPTPYYDATPIFVCSSMGEYIPGDWPY